MEWAERVLEFLRVLFSWPVAFVVVALIFRRPIVMILESLAAWSRIEAKIGGQTFGVARIAEAAAQSRKEIDQLEQLRSQLPPEAGRHIDRLKTANNVITLYLPPNVFEPLSHSTRRRIVNLLRSVPEPSRTGSRKE
jgi:hypothetical protein